MNVLIVSGFLGAGKTTFIQELSCKTKKEFAVMENEYGETGIDGSLLKTDRMKVWELTEGCICCSLKSDFAMSVLTIANTVNPEYLIIEPTGVGLLSSVTANLEKIEYDRIRLLEPVTVADIHCIDSYIETFGEFYLDQIRNASKIVLSKIEEACPFAVELARRKLSAINADAEIITTPYRSLPKTWWNMLLFSFKNKKGSLAPVFGELYPDLETFAVENIAAATIETLIYKLMQVIEKRFGRIYRVKGFVPVNGQWAKFDIVDTRYTIETCNPMPEAKAVFIGTDLKRQELHRFFRE